MAAAAAPAKAAAKVVTKPKEVVVFNFGDSNSDTGSLPAAYGFYLGPPAGRRFFNRTTGRWSDGRLSIDFIGTCLASKPSRV